MILTYFQCIADQHKTANFWHF